MFRCVKPCVRTNPNLLTQTEPGELIMLRNAGNIVPPYGAVEGGEAATIENAVSVLGVKDIRTHSTLPALEVPRKLPPI